MENNYQPNYTSFYDLMSSRYELSDELIESMLKKHPNLSNFKKYNVMDKMDFVEFFGITPEMVAACPTMLFKGDNTIVNKCKLAFICNIDPTPEYILEYHNMRHIMHNYRASQAGKLPSNIDLNTPMKNASGFAGFNDSDNYMRRFNVLGITYAIDKEFKEFFPELNEDLEKYFPQYSYNREKAIAHRKVPIEERKRVKMKTLIKELWANNEMRGKSKPSRVTFALNDDEGVVYSTANYHEETPVVHEIKDLKNQNRHTTTYNENPTEIVDNEISNDENNETTNFENVDTNIEIQGAKTDNNQLVSKQTSNKFNTYKKHKPQSNSEPIDTSVQDMQEFYRTEFGLTENEFNFKLSKTKTFITSPVEKILSVKEKLINDLHFSEQNLHDYVLYVENFPEMEKSIPAIKQKIERLNNLGISLDAISINYKILTRNIDDLEIRAKLAFINDLPIETFLIQCHFVSPSVIWSRMKAFEKGIIRESKYYINSLNFNKYTGIKAGKLINRFPLTEESINEINAKYEYLKSQGKTWRTSYKYSQKFKNIENSNQSEIIDNQVQNNNNLYTAEEQQAIFDEIRSFGNDDDVISSKKQTKTTPSEPLTAERKFELARLFDCSVAELDKMMVRYQSIATIDIDKAYQLEDYLFDNFNITHDDFTLALRANPRLARKNTHNFEAYRTFLKDYLLYDDQQVKKAIVLSSSVLTKDPDDILERTYILARKFKIPFKRAAEILLTSPEAYIGDVTKLEARIDTLQELGIPKKDLIENLNILSSTNKNVKFKYMLAKINGRSDSDFLSRDYYVSEEKAYARTMFNLMNNEELNVYTSEKKYKKELEFVFSGLEKLPSFVEDDKPSEYLKQLYPLGPVQKKQIENIYNLKFNNNTLKLNQEELEYGN